MLLADLPAEAFSYNEGDWRSSVIICYSLCLCILKLQPYGRIDLCILLLLLLEFA